MYQNETVIEDEERYVNLWRGVILQVIIDLLSINIKKNYKVSFSYRAYKYIKTDDFSYICDLARVEKSYIMRLVEALYENKDSLISNKKFCLYKQIKRLIRGI